MAEAEAVATPSTQSSTELTTQPGNGRFTPRITVEQKDHYVKVGDHSFGAAEKLIDPQTPLTLLDNVKKAQAIEVATERMIRHVLRRDGLRLHRGDNWIMVMNRCKKNLYEIYEYHGKEDPEWHIFRKGKLIARICPYVDYRGHLMFRVEG